MFARFDVGEAPASGAKAPPVSSAQRLLWLRRWLEYVAVRGFVAVMRVMPLEAASRFSGWLWGALAPHLSRQRRADSHLAAMMPELSAAERKQILIAMWRNLGQTFVEAMQLDRIAAEPDRFELDASCREIVRRTATEGGIVACAHLGNWEAAAAPFAAAGARVVDVYRPVANPFLNAYLLKLRAPYFAGGLLAKGDRAARDLARHARRGGPIGHMADLRDDAGVPVPFFGRLAPSTRAPAALARRFGRPLFALVLVRVATCRFRMHAIEIEVPHSADRTADVRTATAKIQAAFEGWIRRWPEQWMWAHNRYEYDE